MKNTLIAIVVLAILVVGGVELIKRNRVTTPELENLETEMPTIPENGNSSVDETNVACTSDAKQCPDGSSVGRVAPNCEFAPCPNRSVADPAMHKVIYTGSGFEPPTLTIKAGNIVAFKNESGQDMWVGSDVHPSHMDYAGTTLRDHCPDDTWTAFDQCEAGETFGFTFKKVGTWKYHNHRHASHTGTIIVE
jgi:plastocyanin